MRIIKEGNVSKPFMRMTCRRCGCVFEKTYDEYYEKGYRATDVSSFFMAACECPCCKSDDLEFVRL